MKLRTQHRQSLRSRRSGGGGGGGRGEGSDGQGEGRGATRGERRGRNGGL